MWDASVKSLAQVIDNSPIEKTLKDAEIRYWLALWRVKGVGSIFFKRVLNSFGQPQKVFEQENPVLQQFGFSDFACNQITCFRQGKNDPLTKGVERDLNWLSQDNNFVIACIDPLYPPMLKSIHDSPPLLFVSGNPRYLHGIQVAIVGSRNPTRSGVDNAAAFSSHLLELGIIPTSGLAIGIDGAAHQAAVDKGRPTIAVTGNGLDIIYPKKHHRLAEEIVEYGAIVTEFGTGVAPQASHFPRRNRIISGLSVGVLVVEAALKSGSLITARMALEQGREVFAIPGSIHNPMAKGCHSLIRQGAKLVESAEHILEEVQSLMQLQCDEMRSTAVQNENVTPSNTVVRKKVEAPNNGPKQSLEPKLPLSDLTNQERHIIDNLTHEPCPQDSLIERTGFDCQQLASIMVMLEIKGYVDTEEGGYTLSSRVGLSQ